MADTIVSDLRSTPCNDGKKILLQALNALLLSTVRRGLQMEGVVGYYDHTSVPGHNDLGAVVHDEEIFASDTVTCIGAPFLSCCPPLICFGGA